MAKKLPSRFARTVALPPDDGETTVYLAEWLDALDMMQAEVVEAGAIDKGHASSVCKGERGASNKTVKKLAAAMELDQWFWLLEPPPAEPFSGEAVDKYPRSLLQRIAAASRARALRGGKRKYRRRA